MSSQIFTIRIGINRCYLIRDEGTILVDAGTPRRISFFQKSFSRLAVHPKDIRLIILTHGDHDHVGSAKDLRNLTGARIAIHGYDKMNFENSIYNFPPGVTG